LSIDKDQKAEVLQKKNKSAATVVGKETKKSFDSRLRNIIRIAMIQERGR
jgi:hypothetical protein